MCHGESKDVPLGEVEVGDELRVRPGEKVPVDGVVLDGTDEHRRIDDHRRSRCRSKNAPATA